MQLRPSRRFRAGAADDVPLLVRVLAGNPSTSAAILGCLDTVDASLLRRLHPAVADVVAGVPWADTTTPVVDVVRWRAALPAAVGARVAQRSTGRRLAAMAALTDTTHLDLQGCGFVTDELLLRLPASLHTLNVSDCYALTERASFGHLPALKLLNCCGTRVFGGGMAGLPATLQELDIADVDLPAGASLTHLVRLLVLRVYSLEAGTLPSLPPSLLELQCRGLPPGALFAHLPTLHTLGVAGTDFDDVSLASMPPSLVSLNAHECKNLTPAAVLPPLPLLRLLDVNGTGIGDALVASLPAGLTELRMTECRHVTADATLDHLRALHTLHSYGTDLASGVLAGCRARGCAVPVAGVLRGHQGTSLTLAVLSDGRLASGDTAGEVRVWDVAAGKGEADAVLRSAGGVVTLVALGGGRRLAAATLSGYVTIWDVVVTPPVRTATITCCRDYGVRALTVLTDGRLAAGCGDGNVWVVDADAGAVAAILAGQRGKETAAGGPSGRVRGHGYDVPPGGGGGAE